MKSVNFQKEIDLENNSLTPQMNLELGKSWKEPVKEILFI